jgi:nitrogen regulatory protein P-II 1
MKKIEAIIRTNKLEAVKKALREAGIEGMTVTEACGIGRQKGATITYRGAETATDFVPRMKVVTVVDQSAVEKAVNAIYQCAYTGEIGDGQIFVSNLECVVRIRTGEKQEGLYPLGV